MDFGRFLLLLGGAIFSIGLIIKFAPGLISWFGKLPGDLHIKNEHSTVFIPLTSMIIVSLVLTLLINLFLRK